MKRKMMADLLAWKNEKRRKILLLKGVRQVGKTYLLKEFGRIHFPRYHYFNFEKQPNLGKIFEKDLVPQRILSELSFFSDSQIDLKHDLVIFDEIQESPLALTSLKYFQEDCPDLHLCAAGSLLGLHINSGSFPVGKVTFLTLRPLSFEEFLMANQDKSLSYFDNLTLKSQLPEIVHDHLLEQLKYYFITGGLPEVVAIYLDNKHDLFHAFSMVRKKQDDLLNSYYADISKHAGKVNAMHIDRVFRAVPAQLAECYDGLVSRFKFKGVIPGVTHYDRLAGPLDWLDSAGLTIKVHIANSGYLPLIGHTKENIFKLLLFDVGILGCMSNLSAKALLDYEYGSFKGYFAENFVAQELLDYTKGHLYSWQEKQAEIEFLVEEDSRVIPIEVKSGKNIKARSLKIFAEKYKPPYEVILSGRPFEVISESGVRHYPLYFAGKFPIA